MYKDVETVLEQHGVKPTPQRIVIAEFLLETHSHPTADDVFQAVQDKLPCALSRATVYNTLNALVQAGVVQEVTTEAGRVRYDANVTKHHHFVDVKTGEIIDVPDELVGRLALNTPQGMDVHSYHITFYGEVRKQASD